MATDLETKAGPAKYEAFVESQLTKVRQRIRALDAGRLLMTLGVVTLAYFLGIAVFDLAVGGSDDALSTGVRLAAFVVYVVLMLWVLRQLVLGLYRRVNPFYAAKQLEETIPDAKNSVINWLDLKGRDLPGAIRSAVGQRAARELKQTDPEKAVNPKANWTLGGILAGLALGLLILFALGPNQFGSLLRRAFTPFLSNAIGTRTVITLLKPADGNATVPPNQRVDFQAAIEGRFPKIGQPGAPRLLYRYQAADAFVPLPLDETHDGTWAVTLLGDQIQNGLWYKIAAGDTETPEYQVTVRSLPQAKRFEAVYHCRPYRKLADYTVVFPNDHAVIPRLRDYRGTEVTLTVRTNRDLRAAHLEVDSGGAKALLPAEILPDDKKALRVRLTLERRGTFRVLFTSTQGEENADRSAYPIDVLDDETPRVVLTKPAQDVTLPLGGTLQLEGRAQDDIGLKALALQLKILEGDAKPALRPKVYREGKSFQFDNGTYPDVLDYKDFVVLDKLTTTQGQAFPLKAGMVLEYWLEATDNSDYPNKDGNVGKSLAYKLTITDPAKDDKKQKQDRQNAADQQEKHEAAQDQRNAQENNKRNEQDQGKDGQSEPKKNDSGNKDGPGKTDAPGKNDNTQKNFEKKRDDLEKRLDEDEAKKNKGNTKDQEPKPGKSKDGAGDGKAESKDSKNGSQAGDKKDRGKKDETKQNNQAGTAKDEGPKDQGKQQPGQTKGQGAGDKKPAETKTGDPKSQPEDKGAAKDQPKEQPGQAKNEGQPGTQKPGDAKSDPAGKQPDGKQPDKGQAKGSPDGKQANEAKSKDDKKGEGQGSGKAEKKDNGIDKQVSQAKEKAGQPSGKEASADKSGPPPHPDRQGIAKRSDSGNKADAKKGEQNPQLAKTKGIEKGTDTTETANPKSADPTQVKDAAQPKNDSGAGKGNETVAQKSAKENMGSGELKDKTAKNAANKKDATEDQIKEAIDKLTRLAESAKDPATRKAAKDALEKFKQHLEKVNQQQPEPIAPPKAEGPKNSDPPPQIGKAGGPKDPKETTKVDGPKSPKDGNSGGPKDTAKPDGPKSPKNGNAGGPKDTTKTDGPKSDKGGNSEGPKATAKTGGPKSGDETAKTAGDWPDPNKDPSEDGKGGNSGPGGTGLADPAGQDPNIEFLRKASQLQLDDLKKRMTPETLKNLNWTEDDWRQFLKDAQKYQDSIGRQQPSDNRLRDKKISQNQKGQAAKGTDNRVRTVDGNPRQADPLLTDRALPPPEFRDAYRQFTTSPPGKK
jgi:hypothetical protein